MIIRICSEDKGNMRAVIALTEYYFDSFTIIDGLGYRKGESEPSFTIEIAVLDNNEGQADRFARLLAAEIKVLNKQQAVLVQYIDSQNILV